jgi:hypothetical protein
VTQADSTALQTIINEFQNVSPEITSSFMFKKNGDIVAHNEASTEEQIKKLIAAFNNIADQAETIGGVETLTIQGVNSQLNITSIDNLYLSTVSSRLADEKIVKTLTTVFVPTVVKLVDQIAELSNAKISQTAKPEDTPIEEKVQPEEPKRNESIPDISASFSAGPILPKTTVNQFMVEKIGGLRVSSDATRVDREVIAKWNELYGDKKITKVHIETLEGKIIICKFQPIKEAKRNAQGIIQIPEKILNALQISEGKLVIVKPVITY